MEHAALNGEDTNGAITGGRPCEITFFIPCLNEEAHILDTLKTVRAGAEGISYEVIVVDDGSDDRTAEIVQDFHQHDARVHLVQNRVPMGLGANYFRIAHQARGIFYMLVNGDNVEPDSQIKAILALRGQADMVVPFFGNRDARTMPRRMTSKIFTAVVNGLSGHRLRYYNGAVLHRTAFVRSWSSETHGYGYQAEFLCHLLQHGATYVEVPVANTDRQWGRSKAFSLSNFLSVGNSLLHIATRRLSFAYFRRGPRY